MVSPRLLFTVALTMSFALGPQLQARADVRAGFITTVIAGEPNSAGKVPTTNAVKGAKVNNIDVASPESMLTHGQTYIYAVTFEPAAVGTGTQCATSISLTQVSGGTTVVLDHVNLGAISCINGLKELTYGSGHAIPNSPGTATLIGIVNFDWNTFRRLA